MCSRIAADHDYACLHVLTPCCRRCCSYYAVVYMGDSSSTEAAAEASLTDDSARTSCGAGELSMGDADTSVGGTLDTV